MIIKSGYEKIAHLYDLFDTKKNIDFFCHYASANGEILDIGAGTGRIAIPMAEKGTRVYCVEPSPAMRRVFEKKLSQKNKLAKRITLIEGYASSFRINKRFPAAFLSGSFDHLTSDEDRKAALLNIKGHLENKGKLVFDIFPGLFGSSPSTPAGSVQVGDKEYRRYVSTKLLPKNIQETIIVIEEYQMGCFIKRIEEHSLVGVISHKHLIVLLEQTGFRVRSMFRDYDFSNYCDCDPMLIIEAERKN
jgi:ubiquinone/menaquinone biosynthesis C-methylase UbiE